MKNIIPILIYGLAVLGFSCNKVDTYAAPEETVTGAVIDSVTGEPIETEQPEGIRLQMLETSWSSNPIPWYFWVKPDGTFFNNKVFAGRYKITPMDGPYFPIDGKEVDVKGTTKIEFTVVPFLNVNVLNGKLQAQDTTVLLNYEITRAKVAYKIKDARVFVSTTPYVGNASNDNILSSQNNNDLSGTSDADILSTTYSATVTRLKRGRTYFIRVGARTDDNVSKRYNYSKVYEIKIP